MTLDELNKHYEDLKYTKKCLEKAMEKFKGTDNIENYLSYGTLLLACECVQNEMNRLKSKDWK